jgi:hypothetical protein
MVRNFLVSFLWATIKIKSPFFSDLCPFSVLCPRQAIYLIQPELGFSRSTINLFLHGLRTESVLLLQVTNKVE